MRRRLLVLVAISVGLVALPPAPPAEARSLLGFLGIRIGGHHHAHRHYGRHHTRFARAHPQGGRGRRAARGGANGAPGGGGGGAPRGGVNSAPRGGVSCAPRGGGGCAPRALASPPYLRCCAYRHIGRAPMMIS